MAMKSTGVDWIGSVPVDWNLLKMKHFSYMKGRIGWQGLTADEFTDDGPYLVTGTDFENGRVRWDRSYHISEKRYNEAVPIQLMAGDLLVTKDGTIGKLAYIDELPGKASLNSHLLVIRPLGGRYINRFLYWVLSSAVFRGYYEVASYGSTMDSLSQEKIGEFSFYAPGLDEQETIADWLDRACAQIDDIASDLANQIDVLSRFRKSLIAHSVTHGIDGKPTKQSGNRYIGEIAEDAEVIRFKYIADIEADLVDPSGFGDMPQVAPENILPNTGKLVNVGTVEEAGVDSWNQRFYEGQIVYSKIRPALNKVVIAPFEGLCSADMYPISTVLPTRYLMYFMLSAPFVSQTIEVSSIRVKMPKVNQNELGNFFVVVHPRETMERIADYLDEQCSKVDAVIEEKTQALERIRRHRDSLIFEYVTGKKRVKEVAQNAD